MAFVLLARNGGAIGLLAAEVFATREEALINLKTLDVASVEGEVLLADIDGAIPVIVVAVPVQAPPSSEHDSAVSIGVESAPVPPAHDLSDALRRAASALEREGIVAPESVGSAPEGPVETLAAEGAQASEITAGDWPWVAAGGSSADKDVPALTSEEKLPIEAGEEPWDVYVPDALEAPSADVATLVHASGDDETLSLSRPVIMGSYGDESHAHVPEITPSAVTPEPEPAPALAPEPEPVPEPVPGRPAIDLLADLEDIIENPSATPPVVAEYEPGRSDIALLVCDDCVYLNTCPKVGESDPASCGSFQWKTL